MLIPSKKFICSIAFLFFSVLLFAQVKVIHGVVKDTLTNEKIPYASLVFKKTNVGVLSDSTGTFLLKLTHWPSDTLEVSCVGYEPQFIILNSEKDSIYLNVLMNYRQSLDSIKLLSTTKVGKGFLLWRKIILNKGRNNLSGLTNYSYEQYKKIEVDLRNLELNKVSILSPLWPFKSLIFKVKDVVESNIDTIDQQTYLPVYLRETISDNFYQKKPLKSLRVIRAQNDNGIRQESMLRLLEEKTEHVQVYSNYIPLFNKGFISPFSDVGDRYYLYRVTDTQYVNGRRFFQLYFEPRRRGENTFEGYCQVHDSSFAIQMVRLKMAQEANVNFLEHFHLEQQFQLVEDSVWFPAQEKLLVEISPLGKTRTGFIGRKTTTYRSVLLNDSTIHRVVAKTTTTHATLTGENAGERSSEYWTTSRHEPLTQREGELVNMIDTLLHTPSFLQLTRGIRFMATGRLDLGNFQLGPWFYWVTGNAYEGLRTRFDLGTNHRFHQKLWLHGYLAYGFIDEAFKGKAEGLYLLKKHPRTSFYCSFVDDLDFGQQYHSEVSTDNVFALAIRKGNVPEKFIRAQEKHFELFHETASGFSVTLIADHRIFHPLKNLPAEESFTILGKHAMNTFESGLRLRFAYQEKFLENSFLRTSLGSRFPITEVSIIRAIPGVLHSNYAYTKFFGSIVHRTKISPLGTLDYKLFGGITSGTLPYMFLDIHPGNELYYYNKNAFNLMNKYEFISDRYGGCFMEHNLGSGIFRLIPKVKFRQFWNARILWGNLNNANQQLNFSQGNNFQSLNGRTYAELGTGVDNILNLLRLDLVWRVMPSSLTQPQSNFGVFGSFRLVF